MTDERDEGVKRVINALQIIALMGGDVEDARESLKHAQSLLIQAKRPRPELLERFDAVIKLLDELEDALNNESAT